MTREEMQRERLIDDIREIIEDLDEKYLEEILQIINNYLGSGKSKKGDAD